MSKIDNTTKSETELREARFEISAAKAEMITRLSAEIQRLSERPDVSHLQANQAFMQALVSLAAKEADQQVPENAQVSLNESDGKFTLILSRR